MPRYDSYTIDVDKRRNYYNYKEFGYITRYYRNKRTIGKRRQISY